MNIRITIFCVLLIPFFCSPLQAQRGTLNVTVIDQQTGKQIPFRLHLKTAKGQIRKLPKAPFWTDHNTIESGNVELNLPVGNYQFEIESGPEYTTRSGRLEMPRFGNDSQTIPLQRVGQMREANWFCADLDNRRSVLESPHIMAAEWLDFLPVISWNNSGKNYWESNPLPRPLVQNLNQNRILFPCAGRYEVSGCVVNIFNMPEPILSSDAVNSRGDAVEYLRSLKQRFPEVWIDGANIAMEDLPIFVALGLLDSVEILDENIGRNSVSVPNQGLPRDERFYPDVLDEARWKQDIYFHLLNCGFRIAPSAGSGSGESKNPVGYNRVYIKANTSWSMTDFWDSLKKGQAIVTNGPLIIPSVNGFPPGHAFKGKTDVNGKPIPQSFTFGLTLAVREPISYIEIIKNGKIYATFRMDDAKKNADNKLPPVEFSDSGWFLIRAVTDLPDTYRCAISAPYYVEYNNKPYIDQKSVMFFQKWMLDLGKKLVEQKDKIPPERYKKLFSSWKEARDFWIKL